MVLYNPKWLRGLAQGMIWNVQVHGQAVVVDLGSRGFLFALLTGPPIPDLVTHENYFTSDPWLILRNFGWQNDGVYPPDALELLARRRDVVEVPFGRLPRLVRFRDIQDPGTVEAVDPDDLAASFGPGVRLLRATIAITDAPATTGIETTLAWLKGLKGHLAAGPRTAGTASLANSLSVVDFER